MQNHTLPLVFPRNIHCLKWYILVGASLFFMMLVEKVKAQQCTGCPSLSAESSTYSFCSGSQITIRGNIVSDPTCHFSVKYSWRKGTVILKTDSIVKTTNTANTLIEYSASETGSYFLSILEYKVNGLVCSTGPQIEIRVNNAQSLNPAINASPRNEITCKDTSVVLSLRDLYPAGTTIEWTGNGISATSPTLTVRTAGTFSATVKTPANCTGTATINVNDGRRKPNYVVAGTEFKVFNNQPITIPFGADAVWRLKSTTNIADNALARSGSGNLNQQRYQLASDRSSGLVQYRAARKDNNTECVSDSFTFSIAVLPDDVFIPEIITPNGDNSNDTWNVIFPNESDYLDHEVKVFNRMGIQVYSSDNMSEPWNALNCPNGLYFYIISNKEDRQKVYKGALTILGKQ